MGDSDYHMDMLADHLERRLSPPPDDDSEAP